MSKNLSAVATIVVAMLILCGAAVFASMRMQKTGNTQQAIEGGDNGFISYVKTEEQFVALDLAPSADTGGVEDEGSIESEDLKDAKARDYLVSWVYKYRWGAETSGVLRVSVAWYKTEGSAFLNMVIARLIEVGVIPEDNDLGNPAKEALTILAVTPIPQSMVVTTAGPDWSPPSGR